MDEENLFAESTIELKDDQGRGFDFSLLDFIEYEGSEYAVLLPKNVTKQRTVTVLKVVDVNGDDVADYISVTDANVVNAVFELFKKRLEENI